jgi:hypothetical protein
MRDESGYVFKIGSKYRGLSTPRQTVRLFVAAVEMTFLGVREEQAVGRTGTFKCERQVLPLRGRMTDFYEGWLFVWADRE